MNWSTEVVEANMKVSWIFHCFQVSCKSPQNGGARSRSASGNDCLEERLNFLFDHLPWAACHTFPVAQPRHTGHRHSPVWHVGSWPYLPPHSGSTLTSDARDNCCHTSTDNAATESEKTSSKVIIWCASKVRLLRARAHAIFSEICQPSFRKDRSCPLQVSVTSSQLRRRKMMRSLNATCPRWHPFKKSMRSEWARGRRVLEHFTKTSKSTAFSPLQTNIPIKKLDQKSRHTCLFQPGLDKCTSKCICSTRLIHHTYTATTSIEPLTLKIWYHLNLKRCPTHSDTCRVIARVSWHSMLCSRIKHWRISGAVVLTFNPSFNHCSLDNNCTPVQILNHSLYNAGVHVPMQLFWLRRNTFLYALSLYNNIEGSLCEIIETLTAQTVVKLQQNTLQFKEGLQHFKVLWPQPKLYTSHRVRK